jgi:hypothetical protein
LAEAGQGGVVNGESVRQPVVAVPPAPPADVDLTMELLSRVSPERLATFFRYPWYNRTTNWETDVRGFIESLRLTPYEKAAIIGDARFQPIMAGFLFDVALGLQGISKSQQWACDLLLKKLGFVPKAEKAQPAPAVHAEKVIIQAPREKRAKRVKAAKVLPGYAVE